MFSSQFLTSYCVFSAAVAAYQGMPEVARNLPDDKTVADAFSKATAGMSKKEQAALLRYVLRLIQRPEAFERNKYHRENLEWALDQELGRQIETLIEDDHVLIETDFLARAGITKQTLSQKLRERRVFSIPKWVHKDESEEYYPAFFVDPRYNASLLETVSMALRASPDARKYRFFTTPDSSLDGKTPLEVLASGELEPVVNAAKAFRKRTVIKFGDD